MSVIIYMTSTTTNRDIYHKQSRIKLVLDGKGIKYEEVDLCKDKEKRDYMREKAGIPDLLPPQIFNGDTYCGDFQSFDDALEAGTLHEFLLLK
ncbi:SH3 domain-binding glutamic acid-rich-like protein 3 [Mytilus californianus]|uniref:SH3 domain-binding glutamic acid-rich-like protein 3 n=1 Tax=Mytilus californianus TaxID=6549 RepID=UPI002247B11A|nr:SH3 domain-binding glutamic acid-rich-like protein 3 [Mytilus californianus]